MAAVGADERGDRLDHLQARGREHHDLVAVRPVLGDELGGLGVDQRLDDLVQGLGHDRADLGDLPARAQRGDPPAQGVHRRGVRAGQHDQQAGRSHCAGTARRVSRPCRRKGLLNASALDPAMIVLSRSKNAAAAGGFGERTGHVKRACQIDRRCARGRVSPARGTAGGRRAPLSAIMAGRRGQGPDRATVDCPASPGEVQLNPPELNRRRPPSIPPDGGRPVRSPWADRSSRRGRVLRIGCLGQRLRDVRPPRSGRHSILPHRTDASARRFVGSPELSTSDRRHPQRTNSSVRRSRAAPGLTCGPGRAGRRGGGPGARTTAGRAGGGPDGAGGGRRGLVMVSDVDVLDTVLRTAAAAGCEVVRALDPTEARRSWPVAPLVLLDASAARACADSGLPRRAGRHRGGLGRAAARGVEARGRGGRRARGLTAGGGTVAGGRTRAGRGGRAGRRRRARRRRGSGWRRRVRVRGRRRPCRRPGAASRVLLVDCDPLGGGLDLVLGRGRPGRPALARGRHRGGPGSGECPARGTSGTGPRPRGRAGRAVVRPVGARARPRRGGIGAGRRPPGG